MTKTVSDVPRHHNSPWQRGTNENTNRVLRFWFEKGTDLSGYTKADLKRVADKLNQRPRPTLDLDTPAQRLAALISQAPRCCTGPLTTPCTFLRSYSFGEGFLAWAGRSGRESLGGHLGDRGCRSRLHSVVDRGTGATPVPRPG
jgi:hypothetical protein